MGFRKTLILAALRLTGSSVRRNLKEICQFDRASADEIKHRADEKLSRLLLHAADNVPYYHDVLHKCEVVVDGRVRLENFTKIPILTKDIIRKQARNLYSKDYKIRKPYENTSGGSTGEPVMFIQDKKYDDWNIATKLYFNSVLGKECGEPEIKFWGSDRDILQGTLTLKDRLINLLYNRKFFNSYQLSEQNLNELIAINNSFRPRAYWSYMESALELANYLSKSGKYFHSPEILISTIGPLTEQVRQKIESAMGCKVYNQYGSREVGVIACQCTEQKGLHMFPWWNHVEIIDNEGKNLKSGQGDVVVTTLQNYSMPLIRYKIGDVAVAGRNDCPCGRKTLVLDSVIGRTLGYFKKADGYLAHSHFIVQALFFRDWIKRFQVVQELFDKIVIRVELKKDAKPDQEELDDIVRKIQMVMGQDCCVLFDFVEKIEPSPSGKFIYTICKINQGN